MYGILLNLAARAVVKVGGLIEEQLSQPEKPKSNAPKSTAPVRVVYGFSITPYAVALL